MTKAEYKTKADFLCSQAATTGEHQFAIMRLYSLFEKFIEDIFLDYCYLKKDYSKRKLIRKIDFNVTSRDEVKKFFLVNKAGRTIYIEPYKTLTLFRELIFDIGNDPFAFIFINATFADVIREIISIRNYIAHESEESKTTYIKDCLYSRPFIDVNTFLLTKRNTKNANTNFAHYFETVFMIVDTLLP